MNVLRDPGLERLLSRLHAESDAQVKAISDYEAQGGQGSQSERADRLKLFRSDKLVALDRDKAEFCYQLCRAIRARQVVEIGTSFGVSTLYLAAAVRDNAGPGGEGRVIGTEYEPGKARAARIHFAEAGLQKWIDLREGDLRETLKEIDAPVDFVLVDIWISMARPAIEMVAPHLRPGAILVCDNTEKYREAYADYFAFLHANGFRTLTLPFDGGLELSARG
jgi:predicted O-methyltransferase YrrM